MEKVIVAAAPSLWSWIPVPVLGAMALVFAWLWIHSVVAKARKESSELAKLKAGVGSDDFSNRFALVERDVKSLLDGMAHLEISMRDLMPRKECVDGLSRQGNILHDKANAIDKELFGVKKDLAILLDRDQRKRSSRE